MNGCDVVARRQFGVMIAAAAIGLAWVGGVRADNLVHTGRWRAWLDSPGGVLPFEMDISRKQSGWSATIINGPEHITVPEVAVRDGVLTLGIDYYDSTIVAKASKAGDRLDGIWKKKSAGDQWTQMLFHATAGKQPRFSPLPAVDRGRGARLLQQRWAVKFDKTTDAAVGVFERGPGDSVVGTFLTTTGDYRFLAGSWESERLRLSCFDGAHAFLFHARLTSDDTLSGYFWSRDRWYETWIARPDAAAELPDPFTQTQWVGKVPLADLVFPDVDGQRHSLADSAFAGKARIIEIFGTWCPNCHDASEYLIELDDKYRAAGLSVLGLAFELSGEFSRDARQVRRYIDRVGVTYPVLVAGESDKKKASELFPVLDRIRSYPTFIFMHNDGRVRAVYTGFTGPATGEAYTELRHRFEAIIEELLAESGEKKARRSP